MAVENSYREVRSNFASVLDRVVKDREVVVVSRPGRKKVAIISTEELFRVVEALGLSQGYPALTKLAEQRKDDF